MTRPNGESTCTRPPDLGSIESGKLADFVVLDALPLEDIQRSAIIRWVVKNGELWEAESMGKLRPHEAPAPAFYWQHVAAR